jgi:phenylacetate-CoA ligase
LIEKTRKGAVDMGSQKPSSSDDEVLVEALRARVRRARASTFYESRLDGVDPDAIRTVDDFADVPLTSREEYYADFSKFAPFGSFYSDDVTTFCLTPSPEGLVPVIHTDADLAAVLKPMGNLLVDAGIDRTKRGAIFFNYHVFVAGTLFDSLCRSIGVKPLPMGPGQAHEAAQLLNRYQVDLVICNPTFAFQLAAAGASSPRVLLVTGEAFTAIEGMHERLRSAFPNVEVILDMYGLAEIGPISMNCRHNSGLHVFTDLYHVEIIDPASGLLCPDGTTGELVVTPLHKEASSVIRFRTGDLAQLSREQCECGRSLSMPQGATGRADEMRKVKGVKFYPSQLPSVLQQFETLSGAWHVEMSNANSRDRFELTVEGVLGEAEVAVLRERVHQRLMFSPDAIQVRDQLPSGVPQIVDSRNQTER